MIKWNEFRDGEGCYEAFLPECEQEPQHWLLRVSLRGHVIREVRIDLVWRPRFGPDQGDVAALEAALDALIAELASLPLPPESGAYVPVPWVPLPADPFTHAVLDTLARSFTDAVATLALSERQVARLLELPASGQAEGLFPMAIVGPREVRMQRVQALATLVPRHSGLMARKDELIEAIINGDTATLSHALAAAGLLDSPSSSASETP